MSAVGLLIAPKPERDYKKITSVTFSPEILKEINGLMRRYSKSRTKVLEAAVYFFLEQLKEEEKDGTVAATVAEEYAARLASNQAMLTPEPASPDDLDAQESLAKAQKSLAAQAEIKRAAGAEADADLAAFRKIMKKVP